MVETTASIVLNRLLARGKFRHLQVLLQVAELGSLQRTAEAIGVTQSSVTQTLAYLERLLEAPLFERHARGARPTAACKDLLPVARQVLLGLSAGAEAVVARRERGHSVVRIAASAAATHGLLVDTLPRFAEQAPDISVHLTEAEGEDQLLAIARGEVDLVACRRPPVVPEGWRFFPLVSDRFAVVCHLSHPLLRQARVTNKDLAEHTWVLSPVGVGARTKFDELLRQFPHPPRAHPIITRSPVMVRWLMRYEGVLAYLPYNYVRPLIAAGELAEVSLVPIVEVQPLGLLQPSAGLSPVADRLSNFLQDRFSHTTSRRRRVDRRSGRIRSQI